MRAMRLVWLMTCCLVMVSSSAAIGQIEVALANPRTFQVNREFTNAAGEVVLKGVFQKLSNGRVYVKGLGGKEAHVLMSDLSSADQEFVRMTIESQKKQAHADKVIRESLGTLDISRPVEIAKGCEKLKSLGKYGHPASSTVLNLAQSCPDAKAKYDLFLTFVEISEISEGSISAVFDTLNDASFREVRARIERNPGPFFSAFSKMQEPGLEYLQFVAFRAKLWAPNNPPVAPTEPDKLEVNDKGSFSLRAAAIEAMSNIGGHATLNAVLKTLEASEKPVLGEIDEETIKACLKAFGEIGIMEDEVDGALKRHAEKHPEVVARAREKLAKAQSKGQ